MSKDVRIQMDIDRFLDGFLSTSEDRHTTTTSTRADFNSQWYSYEDEYSYNFCGLE